jgi:hypothetical protein
MIQKKPRVPSFPQANPKVQLPLSDDDRLIRRLTPPDFSLRGHASLRSPETDHRKSPLLSKKLNDRLLLDPLPSRCKARMIPLSDPIMIIEPINCKMLKVSAPLSWTVKHTNGH